MTNFDDGCVTFLFSDIEGSTQLLEANRDGYAKALSEHRRLLRRVCAEHAGDEVGTAGDAYFAVFEHATDAIAAAVAGQVALAAHDWPPGCELRVRMGLHTGEAEMDGGDYVGIAVHTAARVSSAAHGRQILVSGQTLAELGGTVDHRPFGEFSLKGVIEPVALHQILHPQLPADIGAPRVDTAPAPPTDGDASVRVLLVDDQELVRTGFRMILGAERGVTVVGEAANGLEAIAAAERLHPDVVLMDIRMPEMNGIEATAAITAMPDGPRVMMLTTFDLDEYVYDALRAGASGFMLKDAPPADVVRAIEVVAAGESLLAPSITRRLVAEFAQAGRRDADAAPAAEPPAGLSPREVEVLTEIGSGLTNTEIAERLHISEATVKTHVRALLTKLDARDRVQLVITAYESGLVSSAGSA